jgi:hypothetical protein
MALPVPVTAAIKTACARVHDLQPFAELLSASVQHGRTDPDTGMFLQPVLALSKPHVSGHRAAHSRYPGAEKGVYASLVNARDRTTGAATADQQKEIAADRLTRSISQALMQDQDLSAYAHNVKIITQAGQLSRDLCEPKRKSAWS